MPFKKNNRRYDQNVTSDALTACLDANGTYICTAYSPRCYIIQKVTPKSAGLNPNAHVFESKQQQLKGAAATSGSSSGAGSRNSASDGAWEASTDGAPTPAPGSPGYVYMNGDIGKLPSGVVFPPTPGPDTPMVAVPSAPDYSTMNGIDTQGGVSTLSSQEGMTTAVSTTGTTTVTTTSMSPGISANEDDSLTSENGIPLSQLKQMLTSQLEYYFSRENLANDAYLVSQMDSDQYVPIWTVANFNQIKKLTKDIKLITQVLRESSNVQVDEEGHKVRPNHKRCIVILREIPDSTPVEDIERLFSGQNCPKIVSCEFAHNNSWYVTFESDEDAQRAYRYLREDVREFQGKPIMARIKAKPMNRLTSIPPVASSGMMSKNGYRGPGPSPVPGPSPGPGPVQGPGPGASPVDPNAFQNQQRFLYNTNSSVPPNMNYNGQQVHVFAYPQHPPFYSPNILQAWTPPSTPYFDIGSVFSMNGLAPQAAFKPPSRFNINRNRNNKRNQSSSERGSQSDSSSITSSRHQTSHISQTSPSGHSTFTTATVSSSINSSSSTVFRGSITKVQSSENITHSKVREAGPSHITPPNITSHSARSMSCQTTSVAEKKEDTTQASVSALTANRQSTDAHTNKEALPPRLADVVKGTAKPKTPSCNSTSLEKDCGSQPASSCSSATSFTVTMSTCSAAATPSAATTVTVGITTASSQSVTTSPPATPKPKVVEAQTSQYQSKENEKERDKERETKDSSISNGVSLSTLVLSPPPSPSKVSTSTSVKSTADKATKTDDILTNGDITLGTPGSNASIKPSGNVKQQCSNKSLPTTTNAATMTTNVTTDTTATANTVMSSSSVLTSSESATVNRPTYAEVAQHAKEKVEKLLQEQREKQAEAGREKKKEAAKITQAKMMPKDVRDGRFLGRGTIRGNDRILERTDRNVKMDRRRERNDDRVLDRPRIRDTNRPKSPK